ncbi:MAG: hypothetical protein ABSA39_15545 [Edaphobacter sp.]
MNPEQEVLVEIVATNPVLRLITHLIAKQPDHQEIDLLQVVSKDQTGLSAAQSQKALDWLIRKGFLRQLTEDQYQRVKARYSFNVELKEKAVEWNCVPFGSVGTRMLQATAETFNLPSSSGGNVVLRTWPDGNVLDHYGRLIGREEAMEVRQALDQYLNKHEAMTEEEFEKHRESHEKFLWWGSLLEPYGSHIRQLMDSGTVARYLSAPVCNCVQCMDFHERAFTTLTNYFNYEKQEKKQIRSALKALT